MFGIIKVFSAPQTIQNKIPETFVENLLMEYPKSIEIKTTLPGKYLRTQQKISTILSVKKVNLITSHTLCLRNLCHMANLQNKNIKYLINLIFNPENRRWECFFGTPFIKFCHSSSNLLDPEKIESN